MPIDWGQTAAGAGGLLGAGLGNLFSDFRNPSDAAMGTLNQIPGTISPYYQNYINQGQRMGGMLEGQYGQLMNDPGGRMNQIGQSFHESPGFQFALKQALQAAGNQAAAGGRSGTGAAQQEMAGIATGLANQDYNTWLQNALGLYGEGLHGGQQMNQLGYNASDELAQSLANNMMSKAKLQYEGQNAQNQHEGGIWGSILGGLGTLGGAALGSFFMPGAGTAAGASLGGSLARGIAGG